MDPRLFHFQQQKQRINNPSFLSNYIKGSLNIQKQKQRSLNSINKSINFTASNNHSLINKSQIDISSKQLKEYVQKQLSRKYIDFLHDYSEKQRSKSQLSNYGSNTLSQDNTRQRINKNSTLLPYYYQNKILNSQIKKNNQIIPYLGTLNDKERYYFKKRNLLNKEQMSPKITYQKYQEPLLAGRYTVQQKNYIKKKQEKDFNYSHIRDNFRAKMLINCDDMKGILS